MELLLASKVREGFWAHLENIQKVIISYWQNTKDKSKA